LAFYKKKSTLNPKLKKEGNKTIKVEINKIKKRKMESMKPKVGSLKKIKTDL
jgi:hypothetical protein